MATDRLNVTFDGVNEVPRLDGQSVREFFGTPPDRTFLDSYNVYHSVQGNDLVATANLTGSNWNINFFRIAGDDNKTIVRDLDGGLDRRIETMFLGWNSDVELISTRVRHVLGWEGDKHVFDLGDQQQGSTYSIALFGEVNEVTTGNKYVQSIWTGIYDGWRGQDGESYDPKVAGDIIKIGTGGAGSINTGVGNDKVMTGDSNVRSVFTNKGNDKISTGDGYVRMIDAGDGNDTITMGEGGASIVIGGAGNDKFIVNKLPNPDWGTTFWGDDGTDTIDFKQFDQGVSFSLNTTEFQEAGGYNPNTDREGYIAVSVTENILGTKFADELTGNWTDNKMVGRGGADRMNGLEGNDLLVGGGGKDVFVFGADAGEDRVKGFRKGQDKIEIADHSGTFNSLAISKAGKHLEIDHDGGTIILLGKSGLSLGASDFDFV